MTPVHSREDAGVYRSSDNPLHSQVVSASNDYMHIEGSNLQWTDKKGQKALTSKFNTQANLQGWQYSSGGNGLVAAARNEAIFSSQDPARGDPHSGG